MSTPHSVKSYRVSDEAHKALRIRAAETGEPMGDIVDRAIRRELGMMETGGVTWQVIEDGGGGLYLAVFDGNDSVVYFGVGYEHDAERLAQDLDALEGGDDTSGWDTESMTHEEMQAEYAELTAKDFGWAVVADQDGVDPDRMGAAARLAFGIGEEG